MAQVQEMRVALAGLVTILMGLLFLAASVFVVIGVGQWVLLNDSGVIIRALICWASAYVLMNLWSWILERRNR